MTELRRDAINLLEQIPEEKLYYIVQIMRDVKDSYNFDLAEKKESAFQELGNLRRRDDSLNYDDELASYREDKYGTSGSD